MASPRLRSGLSVKGLGIDIDLNAGTNVPGIYAAGICCGNVRGNITSASVWGDIAAESVAEYVKTVPASITSPSGFLRIVWNLLFNNGLVKV